MDSVIVDRKELLEKIKANSEKHRDLFLKAQEGYRKAIIEELDKMLQEAREGKAIRRSITLPEPQDHTDDYERVIEMLTMSTENEIEIQSHEFDCFVRDRWPWTSQALETNCFYAASV